MSYYDYLKRYNADYLNKHESWAHYSWGRGSNFMQLQKFRSFSLLTNRAYVMPGLRFKGFFYFAGALLCIADVYGIWYFQEIYNKYSSFKWTLYQPWYHKECMLDEDFGINDPTEEKKPMTRLKYSDTVKIIYNGEEGQDFFSLRRFRYR